MALNVCPRHSLSRQYCSDNLKLDDGVSSIASFEEVGVGRIGNSCSNADGNIASKAIPDVRYVLQYKRKGNVVECKSASLPKTCISR